MPTHMNASYCNNDFCEVRRGKEAIIELTMTAKRPVNLIHGSVEVFFGRKWLKVDLGDLANVCDHLVAGHCPMKTGDRVTYHGQLTIPRAARVGQKAPVRLRAVDENKLVVACVKVMGKVVRSN